MSHPITTFADVIAPVTTNGFLAQHWDTKPLHIRRSEPDFYERLLTKVDVDATIASGGLRFPAIQLAKRGMFYPPEVFTRSIRSGDDIFTGVPQLERLRAEYLSGATISLPAFHRAWRPLGALVERIEAEFNHPVHTNVYITPGHTSGFAPHYDTHEVFILQVSGHKHWQIYRPTIPIPHRSQPFDPRAFVPTVPLLEVDLSPGDLLYLPRGFVHSTSTSSDFSIHVTLGITVYTWMELLMELLQSGRDLHSMRRALPPGFAGQENAKDALKVEMMRLMADLQKNSDYGAVLDAFTRRIRSAGRPTTAEFDTGVVATIMPADNRR